MYRAFFAQTEWNEEKVQAIIEEFNSVNLCKVRENYFSKNFGGKFFDMDTAKKVGYIREQLKRKQTTLTDKEYAVLMASLIYSIDRRANTIGHFEAYIKKEIPVQPPFELRMIDVQSYEGVEIHQEDANLLARTIDVDLTYLDPP